MREAGDGGRHEGAVEATLVRPDHPPAVRAPRGWVVRGGWTRASRAPPPSMDARRARERRRSAADSHHTRDTVVRECAPRFSRGDVGLPLARRAKRRRGGTRWINHRERCGSPRER